MLRLGVRFDAVVVGGRFEIERRVVLVQEERVAQRAPFVAVGHRDHVEQRPRDLLGEQHREEADEGQHAAKRAEGSRDQEVRYGQEPLHQWPPPGDLTVGVELESSGIRGGHGHCSPPCGRIPWAGPTTSGALAPSTAGCVGAGRRTRAGGHTCAEVGHIAVSDPARRPSSHRSFIRDPLVDATRKRTVRARRA